MKDTNQLLNNYSQIKKDDIRKNAVKTFVSGAQDNLYVLEKKLSLAPVQKEPQTAANFDRDSQALIIELEA